MATIITCAGTGIFLLFVLITLLNPMRWVRKQWSRLRHGALRVRDLIEFARQCGEAIDHQDKIYLPSIKPPFIPPIASPEPEIKANHHPRHVIHLNPRVTPARPPQAPPRRPGRVETTLRHCMARLSQAW